MVLGPPKGPAIRLCGLARMDGTQGPEGPGLVPTRGLRFDAYGDALKVLLSGTIV